MRVRIAKGLLGILVLCCVAPSFAQAAPEFELKGAANTVAIPGGEVRYTIGMYNGGDETTSQPYSLEATFPPGLTPLEPYAPLPGTSCAVAASTVKCTNDGSWPLVKFGGGGDPNGVVFKAAVDPGATLGSMLTTTFDAEGGGAPADTTAVAVRVDDAQPPFGVAAFDGALLDSGGGELKAAGAHPVGLVTDVTFNTTTGHPAEYTSPANEDLWPVEPAKDVVTQLPPGLVGNPSAIPRCSLEQLKGNGELLQSEPLCDPGSQVGNIFLQTGNGIYVGAGPIPLYNMVPAPGTAARFGFNYVNTLVVLDVRVAEDGSYRAEVESKNIPEAIAISAVKVELWGVPGDSSHDRQRSCPGAREPYEGGETCAAAASIPFLRMPTSCSAPGAGLPWATEADSWTNPGARDSFGEPLSSDPAWSTASYETHEAPGFPWAPQEWGPNAGTTDCAAEPFEPQISVRPTTPAADSPSGAEVDLSMPGGCWAEGSAESLCQSDLRDASVTLPAGMSINSSAAGGRQGCTAEQVGYEAGSSHPFRFRAGPQHCPDASKIGSVTIESPLIGEYQADELTPVLDKDGNAVPRPLHGSVYLAAQGDNPFGSLLAMYLVVEDEKSGVTLKLPGRVEIDPATGRLTTVFDENPQLPFSHLHLEFYGGPRAALRTPAACGTYTTDATLTGWNGRTVQRESSFQISQGCGGGFAPKFSAGTTNPLAGQTSPFSLRLTRDDGEGELGGLAVQLPPGVSGYLKGIPYCADSTLAGISGELGTGVGQEANPSCPAASRVGTVTVGAGAGVNPFYTQSGRVYLAGPYKGAPLSLAVVAPAVAGPFDLGSVVVRNALRIDPETAQITSVSDPLPTILHGIPLDLREVRVELNREHFTLNPTNCDPLSVGSTITSAQGATANPSVHFQVAGCESLAFKPKLSLRLSGGTRRSAHPGLRAVLAIPQTGANANISSVQVSLPHSEFVAQNHLADVCTRVQYAEDGGGGAGCPSKSVYGHVVAYTPLLAEPLRGLLYLRSNGGERELPDLVASLGGQIHIDAVGYVGTNKKTEGLRTTFATVPDAPLEKIVLTMPAGKHSLLENSTDICRGTHDAIIRMTAHDSVARGSKAKVQAKGCGGKKHAHRRGHGKR